MSLMTSTSRSWPTRYAQSSACLSFCGLKSWSNLSWWLSNCIHYIIAAAYIITTLAAVRLIPKPPALVESRNTGNSILVSVIKRSTKDCLISLGVFPVKTRWLMSLFLSTTWRMSNIVVNWKKHYDRKVVIASYELTCLGEDQNFTTLSNIVTEKPRECHNLSGIKVALIVLQEISSRLRDGQQM